MTTKQQLAHNIAYKASTALNWTEMHQSLCQVVVQDVQEVNQDLHGNVIKKRQLKFYMKQYHSISTAQHND